MNIELLEKRADGAAVYLLQNDCLTVKVCTWSGCLMDLIAKDKDGTPRDVLLGYDTVDEVMADDGFLGFVVGRVANRIGGAAFTLNGVRYEVEKNNGENFLHGGAHGLCTRNFTPEVTESGLRLSAVIPDMEDGFPGTLHFAVIYALEGDRLVIRYEAESDRDTVVNFTNHAYFNLSGGPDGLMDHLLTVRSNEYCPVDDSVLATGEHRDVTGTPFDLRTPRRIGDGLVEDDEQLRLAGGYDHSFVLSAKSDQATLYYPPTGLELTMSTDLPQVQLYSGNFLTQRPGKGGVEMGYRSGVCLESQFEPNSINSQSPSPTVLRAGEKFVSVTSFRLRVRG